jgi:hypothetical protein
MKLWSNNYHMLVSSLPALPPRLGAARLPISLERLQDRLRMLEPDDAQEMERMIEIIRWSQQFEEASDAAVVKRYGALMDAVTNRLVRQVLGRLMDVRMITTALRRRRRGLGPPPFGIGERFEQIRRHFARPDFGLSSAYPRLAQLAPLLEHGDVLNLHRQLMEATWVYFKKLSDDYYFTFEAVVLYVVRWSVLSQWQHLQAERGRPIFEALVTEALGRYANVYA